jgi:AcrR family transcriptional regulator
MRTKRKPPVEDAKRAGVGRPRKYAEGALVEAALRVMEREGYGALTIRSLAQELGTSHSTLYNYVENVQELETQALHKLTEQLPLPTATAAAALRKELIGYLVATRRLLVQHPGVLFPPVGSASFMTLYQIGERWIQALMPHTPDESTARLALGALVAIVVVTAERDRTYGADSTAQIRKLDIRQVRFDSFEAGLDALIDLVLPGLAKGRKAR